MVEQPHPMPVGITGGRTASGPASLTLVNAKAVTMDPQQPLAEAVAVRGEVVVAVGRRADMEGLSGPGTRTVDCRGMTLLPGFVDAHCHLLAAASSLRGLDCSPESLPTIGHLQQAVRSRARETPRGQWVRGFGYDHLGLAEKRHLNRWDLDSAAPANPVRLDHRSGHAAVLNSQGLRLAGIDRHTPDPVDGIICRDETIGEPTGLLLEMGGYLTRRLGKLRTEDDLGEGVAELNRRLLSYGVTSVQDAGPNNGPAHWRVFQNLEASRLFEPRVTMMAGAAHLQDFLAEGFRWGQGGPRLRLGHVKIMLTTTTGACYPDPETLALMVREARQAGFPVAVHAVEQEAVAAAVDALGAAPRRPRLFGGPAHSSDFDAGVDQASPATPPGEMGLRRRRDAGPGTPTGPHPAMPPDRIEHCSECPPALAARLRRSGAMVVTQPGFVYWNGERYRQEVSPDLLPWLYPLGALAGLGISVAFGSDAPVIDPNPWPAIYSAVTGAARSGRSLRPGGRRDSQTITTESALRRHTLEGAYSEGSSGFKGSIQAGKLADLVLVDPDPLGADPSRLDRVRPVLTIVGGRVAWQSEASGLSAVVPG